MKVCNQRGPVSCNLAHKASTTAEPGERGGNGDDQEQEKTLFKDAGPLAERWEGCG